MGDNMQMDGPIGQFFQRAQSFIQEKMPSLPQGPLSSLFGAHPQTPTQPQLPDSSGGAGAAPTNNPPPTNPGIGPMADPNSANFSPVAPGVPSAQTPPANYDGGFLSRLFHG